MSFRNRLSHPTFLLLALLFLFSLFLSIWGFKIQIGSFVIRSEFLSLVTFGSGLVVSLFIILNFLRSNPWLGAAILSVFTCTLGIIVGTLYFSHMIGNDSTIFFYAMLLVVCPTVYAIFTFKSKFALFLLFITGFFMQSIYFLYAKDFSYIPPRDADFHFQIIYLILKNGFIPFGQGRSLALAYSYYPAMHLLVAYASMLTGVDPMLLLKVSPLIYVLAFLAMYLFTKIFFKSELVALVTTFIFIFTPGEYPMPSYRFLATCFLLLMLFCIFIYQDTKKLRYLLCASVLLSALSFSHHLTLYLALALMIFLYVIGRSSIPIFVKSVRPVSISSELLLFLTLLGSIWTAFVAYNLTTMQASIAREWISLFYYFPARPSFHFFSPMQTIYEQVFILLSVLGVLYLAFIGFLTYRKREVGDGRLLWLSVFLLIVASVFMVARNLNETVESLSIRALGKFFISASIFAGYYATSRATKVRLKTLLMVVLLLCFAIASVDLFPREFYNFQWEQQRGIVTPLRGYGEKVFHSVKWFNGYVNSSYSAVGDMPIHDLGGQFGLRIIYNWNVYNSSEYVKNNRATLNFQYIFIDKLLAMYDQSPTYRTYITRVNEANLDNLGSSKYCNRIYDNGLVQVLQLL